MAYEWGTTSPLDGETDEQITAYSVEKWFKPDPGVEIIQADLCEVYRDGDALGTVQVDAAGMGWWVIRGLWDVNENVYDSNHTWYVIAVTDVGSYTSDTFSYKFRPDPLLPGKPTNPIPADDATEVDFSDLTLSWSEGSGESTDSYNIYTGPQGDLSLVASGVTETELVVNISDYPVDAVGYWRVDAVNVNGTTTGDTWNFDARPGKVSNPTPADDATKIMPDLAEFSWDAGAVADTYDVYYRERGDNWTDLGNVDALLLALTFLFTAHQEYQWRIDSINDFGTTTGDTWNFFIKQAYMNFPHKRRSDYVDDDVRDKIWDIDSQAWTDDGDYMKVGGGRYQNQLIIVGIDDNGDGEIYFGSV